jgi:hypothetical protein
VQFADHIDSERTLSVQDLGNASPTSDVWLKVTTRKPSALNIIADSFNRVWKRNGVMFLFVGFYEGSEHFQPVPFRSVGSGIKEALRFLQSSAVILFRLDRLNSCRIHMLVLQSDGGGIHLVIFFVGAHKAYIDNPKLILNGCHQSVGVAFDVEYYSIVGY